MYALNRNITKFAKRDKRKKKAQHIVFTPFAPDTAEEIINGRQLLKYWTEQAYLQTKAQSPNDKTEPIEVVAYGMEKGKRKVTVLKAAQGYKAYEEMLIYYAMNTLTDDGKETALPETALGDGQRVREWVNLGGQLVPQADLDELMSQIEQGTINSWDEIHERYDQWWEAYPDMCRRHAYLTLCDLLLCRTISDEQWQTLLQRYNTIRQFVTDQVRITRQKDEENLFRQMTYRNDAELQAVLG